jgi:hypothetical protein
VADRAEHVTRLVGLLETELVKRGFTPPPGGVLRVLEDTVQSTAAALGVTERVALRYVDQERIHQLADELETLADRIDARERDAAPLRAPYQNAGRILAALGQVLELVADQTWPTQRGRAQVQATAPLLMALGVAVSDADEAGTVVVAGPVIVAAYDTLTHAIARLVAGEWTIPDSVGHGAAALIRQLRADRNLLGPVPPAPRHSAVDLPPPRISDLRAVPQTPSEHR